MIAYKLVKQKKDGKLYPLFIDNSWAREIGIWYEAGFSPVSHLLHAKDIICALYHLLHT